MRLRYRVAVIHFRNLNMATKKKAPPPRYRKGDFRKVLMVLAAIQELQVTQSQIEALEEGGATALELQGAGASLARLVERTGLDKKTVFSVIRQACFQAGVQISQTKTRYEIVSWGPLLSESGAALALAGKLDGRFVQDGLLIVEDHE
jgi:hypothetical protein